MNRKEYLKFLLTTAPAYGYGGRYNPVRWGYHAHSRLFVFLFSLLWDILPKIYKPGRQKLYYWYHAKYIHPEVWKKAIKPPTYIPGNPEPDARDIAHEQAVLHKRRLLGRLYDGGHISEEEYYDRLFS